MRATVLFGMTFVLSTLGNLTRADGPTKADRKADLVKARLVAFRDPRSRTLRLDAKFETLGKDRREVLVTFRLGRGGDTPHGRTLLAAIAGCYPEGYTKEMTAPSMDAIFAVPSNGIGGDGKGIEDCYLISLKVKNGAPPDKPALRPDKPASSRVNVDKTTITFDPKTCTEGRGKFFWGLGSCEVKVLGHEDSHCVFEYIQEIEMGVTVYLVRVPVDAGPVTVKIDRVTERGSTFPWPVTSFPLDKAKVVRRGGGRGRMEFRVGDTDTFVTVYPAENRSEMVPHKGDTVKFRFELFDGPEFKGRLPGAVPPPPAEFVAGSDKVWPWLRIAMDGMTVGDRRQVVVPLKVAEVAAAWVPKGSDAMVLYLEVSLVSTGK